MEKSKVFYADLASEKVCVHCTHAKMRRDICGIYCKTGRVENGKCAQFEEWKPMMKRVGRTYRKPKACKEIRQ